MSLPRLHALWRSASASERAAGATWYMDAHLEACALADDSNVGFGTVAGVIAALSPNCKWEQNLVDARKLVNAYLSGDSWAYDAVSVHTYPANKTKATRILDTRQVFPHLSGPKVVAFYYNLCGDLSVPTIDSHCINAALGTRAAGSNLPTPGRALVELTSAQFSSAARKVGVEAAIFQATIWIVHRRRVNQGKVPGYTRGL